MAIKQFKRYISEAIDSSKVESIGKLIRKLISKKLEISKEAITVQPGYEIVDNGDEILNGIKFFINRRCFRINWIHEKIKSAEIESSKVHSITFFDGNDGEPTFQIEIENDVSLSKIANYIVQIFNRSSIDNDENDPDIDEKDIDIETSEEVSKKVAMRESYLSEAKTDSDWIELLQKYLDRTKKDGERFPKSRIVTFVGPPALNFFDYLIAKHPKLFEIRNNTYKLKTEIPEEVWNDVKSEFGIIKKTVALDGEKSSELPEIAGVKITRAPKEKIVDSTEIKEDQNLFDLEGNKITYQQQLKNLERMVVEVCVERNGNGLYVYGRGGTGKSTVVEQTLRAHGKKAYDVDNPDKEADFEIVKTGISPSDLFKKCYKYKKEGQVVVLDDADPIFETTEGRNLIKNLTESNNVRVIGWEKANTDLYDPAELPSIARDRRYPVDVMKKILEDEGKIPKRYKYQGSIVCISNVETVDELDPDGALATRGPLVPISPHSNEFKEHLVNIAEKLDFIGKGNLTKEDKIDTIVKFIDTVEKLYKEGKRDRKWYNKKIQIRSVMRAMSYRSRNPGDWLYNAIVNL